MGCTNWKAKYLQAQYELEKAQRARTDTSITIEDVTRPLDRAFVDTLIIPEIPATKDSSRKSQKKLVLPVYDRYRREVIDLDSVKVYLTIQNYLRGWRLINEVRLDSIQYPVKERRIVTRIPIEIDRSNPYKNLFYGALAGIVVILAGLFIFFWRKT